LQRERAYIDFTGASPDQQAALHDTGIPVSACPHS
jgi:hypothetical protein